MRTRTYLEAKLLLNLCVQIFFCGFFLDFWSDAFGGELKTPTRLYRSPHYLMRGDAGIAGADDAEAIFYNPAALATGTGIFKRLVLLSPSVEVSKGTRDLVRQIAIEQEEVGFETLRSQVGKAQHVGLSQVSALVLRRAAISAFMSSEANMMVYKSREDGGLEAVDANVVANAGLNLSLAEKFFSDFFYVGATGRYLRRGVGEASFSILDAAALSDIATDDYLGYGAGFATDLGFMIRNDKASVPWSIGLTVENLGTTTLEPEDESIPNAPKPLKQTVNLGVMFQPGTKLSRLKLLADYRDIASANESNRLKKLHLGGEFTIREIIGAMMGLHQGYPGGGVFLDLRVFRLDLGAYTQELGSTVGMRPDPRYIFRLSAGF